MLCSHKGPPALGSAFGVLSPADPQHCSVGSPAGEERWEWERELQLGSSFPEGETSLRAVTPAGSGDVFCKGLHSLTSQVRAWDFPMRRGNLAVDVTGHPSPWVGMDMEVFPGEGLAKGEDVLGRMKHLWEQCWVNHIPPSPKPLQTARKQCDESSRDEIREGNNYLQTCSSWEAPPSCRNSLGQRGAGGRWIPHRDRAEFGCDPPSPTSNPQR